MHRKHHFLIKITSTLLVCLFSLTIIPTAAENTTNTAHISGSPYHSEDDGGVTACLLALERALERGLSSEIDIILSAIKPGLKARGCEIERTGNIISVRLPDTTLITYSTGGKTVEKFIHPNSPSAPVEDMPSHLATGRSRRLAALAAIDNAGLAAAQKLVATPDSLGTAAFAKDIQDTANIESKTVDHVAFYITNSCSLACPACLKIGTSMPSGQEISFEEAARIIDRLKEHGMRSVTFTGGEPLLVPDIIDILKYAHQQGFRVNLQTSGVVLNEALVDTLEPIIDELDIPIEGSSEEIHVGIMGERARKQYQNVQRLLPILKNRNFTLVVGTIATKTNRDDLLILGQQLADAGVTNWMINQYCPEGRGARPEIAEKYYINDREFEQITRALSKSNFANTINIAFLKYDPASRAGMIFVNQMGNVLISTGKQYVEIANIFESENLAQVLKRSDFFDYAVYLARRKNRSANKGTAPMGGGMVPEHLAEYATRNTPTTIPMPDGDPIVLKPTTADDLVHYITHTGLYYQIDVIREALRKDAIPENLAKLAEFEIKFKEWIYAKFMQANRNSILFLVGKNCEPILIPMPIEAVQHSGEGARGFVNTLQGFDNVFVKLYRAEGAGEPAEDLYEKHNITRKPLPEGFVSTRENTLTLLPVEPDEEISLTDITLALSNLGLKPQDTIISPIGLQHDPIGLLRGIVFGFNMLNIARNKPSVGEVDESFVQPYQALCESQGVEGFNLTAQDLIHIAIGDDNELIKALRKLIELLPIVPLYVVEDVERTYENAKKALKAL